MKCEYDDCNSKAIGKFCCLVRFNVHSDRKDEINIWLCKQHLKKMKNL